MISCAEFKHSVLFISMNDKHVNENSIIHRNTVNIVDASHLMMQF